MSDQSIWLGSDSDLWFRREDVDRFQVQRDKFVVLYFKNGGSGSKTFETQDDRTAWLQEHFGVGADGGRAKSYKQLRDEAGRLTAFIRSIEWGNIIGGGGRCPCCYQQKEIGHKPSCVFAKTIESKSGLEVKWLSKVA